MTDELFAREQALSAAVKLVQSADIRVEDATEYAGKFLAFLLGGPVTGEPGYEYFVDEEPCQGVWPEDTIYRRFRTGEEQGQYRMYKGSEWRDDPTVDRRYLGTYDYRQVGSGELPEWVQS